MSINAVILASIYILIGIIQLFAAIAALVGQKNLSGRFILSGFLISLSINNFMIPLFQGDVTSFEQVWLTIRLVLMLTNVFYLPLFAIVSLRPKSVSYKWPIRIFMLLIALPTVVMLLDFTGVSQSLFSTLLIGGLPRTNIDQQALLGTIQLVSGALGGFFQASSRVSIIGVAIFSFAISFLDRKQNPANSRTALILGISLISITMLLLQFMSAYIVVGLTLFQIIFTFGITYTSMAQGHDTLSFDNLQSFFSNWPMFNKLMFAVMGVVFPSVILLSLTSVVFLQSSFTELIGGDLYTLAQSQQKIIQSTIAQEVKSLSNLGREQQTQSLIASRISIYQGRTEDEIFQQLRQAERTWQREGEDNQFISGIMSSTRNAHLLDFIQLSPQHASIVIADEHGGLVTATEHEVTFDQSRTIWWQQVINTNYPYIGIYQDGTQENPGEVFIEIAIPIQTDENPNDIEGVLMSRYSLSAITNEVYSINVGDNGGLSIFAQNKFWIHPPMDSATVLQEPNPDWNYLTRDPFQFWQITDYAGTESMVAWAPFEQNLAETGNLNWILVAHKPSREALSPISNARWTALLIGGSLLVGSIVLTAILARLIVQPLLDLTDSAEEIRKGNRHVLADISGTDEIGVLATTINAVTSELNLVVESLEDTITERTVEMEKRALQLETSALVAREAASIRNLEVLLNRVSDLITERFGFYHTGIFLVDENSEYAVLRAANSPGGKRMLGRGHKLQIGKVGVVGFAAGVGESRMAQDVGADVVYYDNPDMPDTRSELALPLKVREAVIGVLDVQSTRANAFEREDVQVLELLADQIALAIDNTRLLESSQRALVELQHLYGQRASNAWKQRLENESIEVQYDPTGLNLTQSQMTQIASNGKTLKNNIIFRGQVIGAIELIREDSDDDWSLEEQTLVAEIIEQAALALENARLVDQIRLRSDQIQLLQEVTALSAGLINEKDLLDQVTAKIQSDMGLLYVNILTIDAVRQTGHLTASAAAEDSPLLKSLLNQELDLKDNEIILEVIQYRRPLVIYALESNPRTSDMAYYKNYENAHTLVIAPLIARGEVIGIIDLSTADTNRRFEVDELTLLDQISTQIASALDSTRLFSQTSQRAERERLVAEITNKVRASNDPETIIQTAVQELQQALGVKHAQVILDNGKASNGQTKAQNEEPTINIQESNGSLE